MSTKRLRSSGKWEYVVKRKGLLPAPIYLTFDTEAEGDRETAKLEALLDKGVVPPLIAARGDGPVLTVRKMIRDYQGAVAVGESDKPLLDNLTVTHDGVALSAADYVWGEDWVAKMKREQKLAPGTIRHYVGALSRCFNWCVRRKVMLQNPLLLLPRGYANYSEQDARIAGVKRKDQERERRLSAKEEEAILEAIDAAPDAKYLRLMFVLAVETAMRMRETYTLTADQIDLKQRTIFLDETKNGDRRQVPLSSVAMSALKEAKLAGGQVFPWWDSKRESLTAATFEISRMWARVFDAAGCPDLHYHDFRHEATSRFYERTTMSDLEIAKITGHKDLRMLRRYANLRGSNLAVKLW